MDKKYSFGDTERIHEFFAPDSFNRDSVLTYCTAAKGGDISATAATMDCYSPATLTIDGSAIGLNSCAISASVDKYQEQIDSLREAVEELKASDGVGLLKDNRSKRDRLRDKLRTLKCRYEVL